MSYHPPPAASFYVRDIVFNGVIHHIKWNDILYITTLGEHTLIWKKETQEPIETALRLARLIQKFTPPPYFYRTHNQYLVNENAIEKIVFRQKERLGRIWMEGKECAFVKTSSPFYKKRVLISPSKEKDDADDFVNGHTKFINIPPPNRPIEVPESNPLDKYSDESVVDVSTLPKSDAAAIASYVAWVEGLD